FDQPAAHATLCAAYEAIQKIGNNKCAQRDHDPPEKWVVLVQQGKALHPQHMQAAVVDVVPECHDPHEQVIPDECNHDDHHHAYDFLHGGEPQQGVAKQAAILAGRLLCLRIRFHTKYFNYAIASVP